VVLLLVIRWYQANLAPNVAVPPKISPSPNAFDSFKAAAGMVGIGNGVSLTPGTKNYANLAAQRKLITTNALALQQLQDGFQYEYLDTSSRSFATMYPYFAGYRSLAKLLVMKGNIKAADGDWEGSVSSDLDAVRIGEMCPHGAPVIGMLVGEACQSIGRKPIWDSISRLNGAQCKRLAARYEEIIAKHEPFADVLTEEKYMGENGMAQAFKGGMSMKDLNNLSSGSSDDSTAPAASAGLYFLLHSKSSVISNYAAYMDSEIARAKLPYAHAGAPTPVPNDPFVRIIVPVFEGARIKEVDGGATQNRLLLVAIALRGYYADHGAYPASLGQLAPGYLKSLPDDPFAASGTFKYRLADGKYLLYSVGPDGVDNGGKAIDVPVPGSSNVNARYYVQDNSKGDIVAGTNTY
jgi:hypothetical protein